MKLSYRVERSLTHLFPDIPDITRIVQYDNRTGFIINVADITYDRTSLRILGIGRSEEDVDGTYAERLIRYIRSAYPNVKIRVHLRGTELRKMADYLRWGFVVGSKLVGSIVDDKLNSNAGYVLQYDPDAYIQHITPHEQELNDLIANTLIDDVFNDIV